MAGSVRRSALRQGMTALAVAGLVAWGLVVPAAAFADELPEPRLRADTNRDGRLSISDDWRRDRWNADRGAIVLPNLDDDTSRCPTVAGDGSRLSDDALAGCNDAADEVVNGEADLDDLARLRVRPMRDVPVDATVRVAADKASSEKVRIFVKRGTGVAGWRSLGSVGELTAEEARSGVDLAIEAREIVRDRAAWDGFVDLELTVSSGGRSRGDAVRMRVAPLLFVDDLMRIDRLMVSDDGTQPKATGSKRPVAPKRPNHRGLGNVPTSTPDGGERAFRADLRRGADQAGVDEPFVEYATGGDIWVQDLFEPGYVSMPAEGGKEHRMRIYARSPNTSRTEDPPADRPLREAGRSVFAQLRGPDAGAVQQYDPGRFPVPEEELPNDTFNATGNFGSIPPYSHAGHDYPTGRKLFGATGDFAADPTYRRMLDAQGYQDPVVVDTSWLGVGHIDEIMTFLPSDNARGWVLGLADPRLAEQTLRRLVEQGYGDRPLVNGVDADLVDDPDLTVRKALEKDTLRRGQRIAGDGIDRAVDVLKKETGLTERDIVRLPVLFDFMDVGYDRPTTYAYLPDAANGISTGTDTYLAPKQHGPRVGSTDVFQRVTEQALAANGTEVAWVEDWEYAHVGVGEIHCVTNADRDLGDTTPWWRERA